MVKAGLGAGRRVLLNVNEGCSRGILSRVNGADKVMRSLGWAEHRALKKGSRSSDNCLSGMVRRLASFLMNFSLSTVGLEGVVSMLGRPRVVTSVSHR